LRAEDDGSNRTYTVTVSDSDNVGGSGLGPDSCKFSLYDTNSGWIKWREKRTCSGSFTFTVGPTGDCRTEEDNKCIIWVESKDIAENWSKIKTVPADKREYSTKETNYFPIGIDWTKPTVE
jgi:hypothetical protein